MYAEEFRIHRIAPHLRGQVRRRMPLGAPAEFTRTSIGPEIGLRVIGHSSGIVGVAQVGGNRDGRARIARQFGKRRVEILALRETSATLAPARTTPRHRRADAFRCTVTTTSD